MEELLRPVCPELYRTRTVEHGERIEKAEIKSHNMKTGTAIFRVIVLIWLAGLTVLCLGQAVTMVQFKEMRLGIAQMLAANANLTMAVCKATAPGDYQDAELQRILTQMSACRTWDDLVKMP